MKYEMANAEPWLSVIVPCWQASRYLERLLQNFIEQASGRTDGIEFILVDDWSGDDVSEIVSKFSDRMNIRFMRSYKEWKRCPGNCRQAGLDAAVGRWVMFVDQDDLLDNCMLDAVRLADENIGWDESYVLMRFKMCREEGGRVDADQLKDHSEMLTWLHGKVYRRTYLVENGIHFLKDLEAHEDAYFNRLFSIYLYLIDKDSKRELLSQGDLNFYRWREDADSTSFNTYKYLADHFIDGFVSTTMPIRQTYGKCAVGDYELLFRMFLSAYEREYSTWLAIYEVCPEYYSRLDDFLQDIKGEVYSMLQVFGYDIEYMIDYISKHESEICTVEYRSIWGLCDKPVSLLDFTRQLFNELDLSVIVLGDCKFENVSVIASEFRVLEFPGKSELLVSIAPEDAVQDLYRTNMLNVRVANHDDVGELVRRAKGKWIMFMPANAHFGMTAGNDLQIIMTCEESKRLHNDIAVWTNCEVADEKFGKPRETVAGHLYSREYLLEKDLCRFLPDEKAFNDAVIDSLDVAPLYFENGPCLCAVTDAGELSINVNKDISNDGC